MARRLASYIPETGRIRLEVLGPSGVLHVVEVDPDTARRLSADLSKAIVYAIHVETVGKKH